MTIENCRNLIIGSGEAGKYLAWTLGRQGEQVTVVERALIGGSCPNIACLPSKNLIHSAKVASLVRRADEFGMETGPVKVHMTGVIRRKPELAHVGLSETEANTRNIPYRLAKMPMAAILRTRTVSEPRGFLKALVGNDDRILGCTAFGLEANELVATVQAAMLGGMPYTTLSNGIFTHPAISEGLTMLFGTLPSAHK